MKFFSVFKRKSKKKPAIESILSDCRVKRDEGEDLNFEGFQIAHHEWPWAGNERTDTTIVCGVLFYQTSKGTFVTGQARINLQPMIKNPKKPDEVFYAGREFTLLNDAIDWIENGRLRDESFPADLVSLLNTLRTA
jgi:hypothetical protein